MAATGQVTCPSNAATAIIAAANANATYVGAGSPRVVVLTNPSAQGIYLGGTNAVTTATGYLLAAGASVTLTLYAGDAIFGRGAQFSPVIHYLISGA